MLIEVGCLVRQKYNDAVWLVLDEIADSILIVNQKTNYKMWAEKSPYHFEVVG